MNKDDFSNIIEKFLIKTIKEAGKITLDYFRKDFTIRTKEDNQGIVTSADLASENWIKSKIHKRFPLHDILAEESGLESYNSQYTQKYLWIIDPLDGTTNFSKGNSYYCISIAFGEIIDGLFSPLCCSVYHPAMDLLYSAKKNQGTFVNGKRVSVSSINKFNLASFATGFSSNKGTNLQPLFKTMLAIQNKCLGLRINGAAALDLANTAYGVFEGFYEIPLAPWDLAAGALLITEAGGVVTNFAGDDFCPLKDKGIIAGNKFVFPDLMKIIIENYW